MSVLDLRRWPRGAVCQVVRTDTGAMATGTTTIPFDDTIPQSTEGDQYMSLSITPRRAANLLLVTVQAWLSSSIASAAVTGALFQDSGANALVVSGVFQHDVGGFQMLTLSYQAVANTVANTTFKFRAGAQSANTTTFNGQTGGRLYGGVINSFMEILEFVP
jgi:hypothetical protein